ncbi:hypothetical protein C7999DRAFT_17424 [Corynascus novoguineensis]|uniref:Xylanolytic transcriptional activator regulatory domain-containing protein n=1 Tax=Corynascus novoguineensis TaxID=1126955 RepID=A0AAN7CN51_9PEZI|nr:hypothetical protein C7999DRAFT_17424 [Corynascus novoguineensis]
MATTSVANQSQSLTVASASTASPSIPGAASANHDGRTSLGSDGGRRREKRQLSCNLCRRRNQAADHCPVRLRCDRQQPCSNCSSRGMTCTYVEHPATIMGVSKQAAIHERIIQLERLVMSLIPGSGSNPTPKDAETPDDFGPVLRSLNSNDSSLFGGATLTPAETAAPTEERAKPMDARSECGSMRIDHSEQSYVGGDHWAAILESIVDIKEHIEREERRSCNQDDCGNVDSAQGHDPSMVSRPTHALLLYGCPLPAVQSEVLSALPPKSASDRYVSRYFNRLDLVHCCYEAFWTNPSEAPIIWVGLLFSMICLALQASDTSDTAHGDPEHRFLQIDLYREKTVQCLLMGEYTRGGAYILETLIHYIYIEMNLQGGDAGKDTWSLLALEVNLAMQMGYHRDPSHFPAITPLQGEVRRRLWATVLQGDVLVSVQMGMPRMISDWKCDTAEPRNLSDADIDHDTPELPQPRPETEFTPALGIIARRRIFQALGAVADLAAKVQPCNYAEVMKVDGVLHDAIANIPPLLRPKPMTSSVTDAPDVIMSRLFIQSLFYKGQLMLHRRFLHAASVSEDSDDFIYSRTACLTASLGALEVQNILDEETCPGGQLHMMRWRVSSILNNIFLTATMVLCSMLHRGQTLQRKDEIVRVLKRTRSIWLRASIGSREADKAAKTVNFVLSREPDGHSMMDETKAGVVHGEEHSMPQNHHLPAGEIPASVVALDQDFRLDNVPRSGLETSIGK